MELRDRRVQVGIASAGAARKSGSAKEVISIMSSSKGWVSGHELGLQPDPATSGTRVGLCGHVLG